MRSRAILLKAFALGLLASLVLYAAPDTKEVTVYKFTGCGCCSKWVEHLKANGFTIAAVHEADDNSQYRKKYGVPEELASCHTAVVDGYVIEGHVPAADIQRLLKERPKAKGLVVGGMPAGSPGMDAPHHDGYSVLLIGEDGKTTVYHKYEAQ